MTDWYPLLVVLVTVAAWRMWALTARDMILDRWRDRFAPVGTPKRDWLECPYCAGFWWAGVWAAGLVLVLAPPFDWWSVGLWWASWWATAAGVVFVELVVDTLDAIQS